MNNKEIREKHEKKSKCLILFKTNIVTIFKRIKKYFFNKFLIVIYKNNN